MSTTMNHKRVLAAHQAQADRYAALLRTYTEGVDLNATVIATADGIEIVSFGSKAGVRPAQLAAMACSLLAVAVAAGREVGHGACERLFIETRSGALLLKPVGRAGELVLCMALSPRAVMAKAFWSAEQIGKALAPI